MVKNLPRRPDDRLPRGSALPEPVSGRGEAVRALRPPPSADRDGAVPALLAAHAERGSAARAPVVRDTRIPVRAVSPSETLLRLVAEDVLRADGVGVEGPVV